jgi:dUTP pyrophosphatase
MNAASLDSVIRFVRIRPDAKLPVRATPYSAAFDLYAAEEGAFISESHTRTIIPTGFGIEMPPGYVGLVCSRSGLANSKGWFVLNSPGVIDSDYRGEIKVILGYLPGNIAWPDIADTQLVKKGASIAQLLILPAPMFYVQEASAFFTNTERGANGFGSTGL